MCRNHPPSRSIIDFLVADVEGEYGREECKRSTGRGWHHECHPGCVVEAIKPIVDNQPLIEKLDDVAMESTSGWNNAGTGHAAYCELNYTPEKADGSIDASKAYAINESFERTLQFWSYLVQQKALPDPTSFINPTPHLSFVWGEKNVAFLRKRFAAIGQHPMFAGMEYSEDPAVLRNGCRW